MKLKGHSGSRKGARDRRGDWETSRIQDWSCTALSLGRKVFNWELKGPEERAQERTPTLLCHPWTCLHPLLPCCFSRAALTSLGLPLTCTSQRPLQRSRQLCSGHGVGTCSVAECPGWPATSSACLWLLSVEYGEGEALSIRGWGSRDLRTEVLSLFGREQRAVETLQTTCTPLAQKQGSWLHQPRCLGWLPSPFVETLFSH